MVALEEPFVLIGLGHFPISLTNIGTELGKPQSLEGLTKWAIGDIQFHGVRIHLNDRHIVKGSPSVQVGQQILLKTVKFRSVPDLREKTPEPQLSQGCAEGADLFHGLLPADEQGGKNAKKGYGSGDKKPRQASVGVFDFPSPPKRNRYTNIFHNAPPPMGITEGSTKWFALPPMKSPLPPLRKGEKDP
jgi:hypothetical protein